MREQVRMEQREESKEDFEFDGAEYCKYKKSSVRVYVCTCIYDIWK